MNVVKAPTDDMISKYGKQAKNGLVMVTLKEGVSAVKVVGYANSTSGKSQTIPKDVVYVVDGKVLPKGADIDHVSPADIESVSVLKGKSAVAIYGGAAQNGAILITTKVGAKAATSITADTISLKLK